MNRREKARRVPKWRLPPPPWESINDVQWDPVGALLCLLYEEGHPVSDLLKKRGIPDAPAQELAKRIPTPETRYALMEMLKVRLHRCESLDEALGLHRTSRSRADRDWRRALIYIAVEALRRSERELPTGESSTGNVFEAACEEFPSLGLSWTSLRDEYYRAKQKIEGPSPKLPGPLS